MIYDLESGAGNIGQVIGLAIRKKETQIQKKNGFIIIQYI